MEDSTTMNSTEEVSQETVQDEGINIFSHKSTKSSQNTKNGIQHGLEDLTTENGKNKLIEFTEEQKLELLQKETPELLNFLDVFQTKAMELKEKIDILIERINEKPHPTDEGVSYINVKFYMMLCYLGNLSYYLHCKSSGLSVHDHPVILQLIRMRTFLEKIRPLDNKLKYQIEKLLRMAVLQSTDDKAYEESKLAHKANIKNFSLVKDEDNEVGEKKELGKMKYIPPKRQAVVYDDAKSRAEKSAQRRIDHAKRGRMLELLKDYYSDTPETLSATSERDNESRRERNQEDSITKYEEDTMTRLSDTKKKGNKKKRRGDPSLPNALAELESYSDLAVLSLKEQDQDGGGDGDGLGGGDDGGGGGGGRGGRGGRGRDRWEGPVVDPFFVVGGEDDEDDDYDEDMGPPKKRARKAGVGDSDRKNSHKFNSSQTNNQKKWLSSKNDKKQNKFPSRRGRR